MIVDCQLDEGEPEEEVVELEERPLHRGLQRRSVRPQTQRSRTSGKHDERLELRV